MAEPATRVELEVTGMRCAGCSDAVAAALQSVPGVESAEVSHAAGMALVRGAPEIATPAALAALSAAVHAAGYGASPAGATAARAAWRSELRAAVIASAIAVVLLLLDHFVAPHLLDAAPPAARAAWCSAALALLALLWPGRSFLRGAWQGVKRRRGSMDLLVAVGAGSATLAALLAAAGVLPRALDHGHAAVWLVAFLRIGKLLEAKVRASASSSLFALLDALPDRALRQVGGVEQECETAALAPGDRIVVRPAERLAADGVVTSGRSSVDEAAVTGEPMPVDKEPGSPVFAGTINHGGRLVVEVGAAGAATRLGQMAALVRQSVFERTPVVGFADRVAAVFVPIVLSLAALTAIGWAITGASLAVVVARALATVVISCPCALALATPTAVLAGASVALKGGILVKDGSVLEALASVRAVLFDKTGTLTVGRPVVGRVLFDSMDASDRTEAAGLALASRHPAAAALAAALGPRAGVSIATGARAIDPIELEGVVEEPGLGVRARHAGRELRLGRPEWVASAGAADPARATPLPDAGGATVVAFGRDGELRAAWTLDDALKPGARAAVERMRKRGCEVELVTGDRIPAARAVGGELGLPPASIHGACTPASKAALVAAREQAGLPVLFVGDGFNDGAALAAATVGAAIGASSAGGGTDLARAAGRLVLLSGDPRAAVTAIDVGRATLRSIRQNLFLAAAYNVVAIPWAMGLLAPLGITSPEPAKAGLAMAASSLAVVLNAFRLTLAGRRLRDAG